MWSFVRVRDEDEKILMQGRNIFWDENFDTFINPILLPRVLSEGGKGKADATDPLDKVQPAKKK